jgi:hypothetical protein
MHQVFSAGARWGIFVLTLVGTTVYCFSNYMWDLPHTDFRPFKEGVHVGNQKQLEEEAAANVDIVAYKLRNIASGEVVELPYDQYLKEYKNYPKEEWDAEQVQTEPEVPATKISDFGASDEEGNDATEALLFAEGYSFMFVAHKLYGEEGSELQVRQDTIYQMDTIPSADTVMIQRSIAEIKKRQVSVTTYDWDDAYLAPWKGNVAPIMEKAMADGHKAYGFTAYADPSKITSFKEAIGVDVPFYTGDDILLKTIVRSNPGLVLMKDGKIVAKFHHNKLPTYDELKTSYMTE